MTFKKFLYSAATMISFAALPGACLVLGSAPAHAQQAAVPIDDDDIGGVVRGPVGPEAGVWVIAETTELPTKFAKMVVTDDQGRYVIPDLPKNVNYQVWVRGYGLVDSAKVRAKPGQQLNLTAIPAPNEAAAAHYYPAIYWYAMMKMPPATDFGGVTDIPKNITREIWRARMGNVDCIGCHQLGQESTRTIPAALGEFSSGADAWARRIASGHSGEAMVNRIAGELASVPLKYFGDWTDRVAKGELPKHKPQRPAGIERNIVISSWEWGTEKHFIHDLISSDRRYPTVNAYGPLFGSPEYSSDDMPILDPKTHKVTVFKTPVADPNMPETFGPPLHRSAGIKPNAPSPYWGNEKIWSQRSNNHNAMFDKKGRVWFAAAVRGIDNPAFCKKGSDHPSAKAFPLDSSARQLSMLEPKTMKYSFIDTCFGTHHPQFGYDADDTLWHSGSGPVAGWINTKVWDETGDAAKAQGWAPFVLDTNANGKVDEYTEPGKPAEAGKDMRIAPPGPNAVMPHPTDGSVWYTVNDGPPGFLRFDPKTKLSEFYVIPKEGIGVRGGDIDKNGVLWGSGSNGTFVSFDRRKCKGPLNGPNATGNHCPEGFAYYKYPGPSFEGFENGSAEASYYSWVDHHNTLGFGDNVPISTANLNEGFVALKDGQMVMLRIPYPMGFYAKGLDGRIDDPNAGWKGRGLWSTNGDRTPWLMEGGKGSKPRAVHIQLRSDPLAK